MASLLSLLQSFDLPKPPRRLPVWVPASVAGVVVLVAAVLAVAIPRALRSPDVLATVPFALAKPGVNGLAGAPDPGGATKELLAAISRSCEVLGPYRAPELKRTARRAHDCGAKTGR